MSTIEAIERLIHGRKLIERPSSLLGISARSMLVTPDIDALARPPFEDTERGERHAALASFLDAFCELNMITVSEEPFSKPSDVMLARVSPVEADFWSMRITDPEETAGMRVLGAFYGKDAFVALTAEFREDIHDFGSEVGNAQEIWRDHFGTSLPHSGRCLDDYITNYYKV